MKNKLLFVLPFVAVASANAALTSDPTTGLTAIEGYADSAIAIAIAIGAVVIGWGYVRRLVKKG